MPIDHDHRQHQNALAFVQFLIGDYGEYHHQKEQMAYGLTVLYLTAATILLSLAPPFWKNYAPSEFLGFAILLFITALGAISLVVWQFDRRLWANDWVAAATNLATGWLTAVANENDLAPTPIPPRPWGGAGGDLKLPAALVREFIGIGARRRCFWFPRDLSVLLLVLWTVAVFVHLGRSWSPQ